MAGTIDFQPSQQDYIDANRLWMRRSRAHRWMRWFMAAVAVLAIVNIAFSAMLGRSPSEIVDDVGVLLAVFLLLLATCRLAVPLLIPRQVRRMFEQRPGMADPMHCAWDDEHIVFTAATGTTNQPWATLYRWYRNEKTFVFLMTERMMLIVPRRALSPDQMADLEATAGAFGPKSG